jgi:ABC-type Fe3+/spermidine/putrescine transport system ATPase subunit
MELSINDLSKTYANGVVALDHVCLNIPTGLFGLLGPNGAGKSTLMRTIATLQEPDSGKINLEGIDVLKQKGEVKKLLGYLPQDFGFYAKDTAYNLLDHFTLLKGVKQSRERKAKVEELLRRVNLWNERNQKLGTFSNGMRQRFGIAQVLIGKRSLYQHGHHRQGKNCTQGEHHQRHIPAGRKNLGKADSKEPAASVRGKIPGDIHAAVCRKNLHSRFQPDRSGKRIFKCQAISGRCLFLSSEPNQLKLT